MRAMVVEYSECLTGLVGAIVVLFFACSSSVDPDYEAPQGGVHPFAATADHGSYLVDHDYDFQPCTVCHGAELTGQASGVDSSIVRSCYECHRAANHQVGFADAASEHPDFLVENGWNLAQCYGCHYPYGDPTVEIDFGGSCSATDCHNDGSRGPEACNTCHGQYSAAPADTASWAPPPDLRGNTSTSGTGVGAHVAHLTAPSGFAASVACETCHLLPDTFADHGHVDSDADKSDVVFDYPATADESEPTYEHDSATCSSTHCHGDVQPVWTQVDGTWVACGSCHGIPPPASPHPQVTLETCQVCHGKVIDSSGTIIAPELHVNGVVDGS